MLPLIAIAASLVPELIRLINGDKTNKLAAEVSHVVTDVVGTQDETQARAKLTDPAVAAKLQTRLAEIALDAQRVQAQAESEQRQADFNKLKTILADAQGARSLTTTLADKGSPIAWGAPIISVIIGIGFFIVLGMAIFGGDFITKNNSNIVYTLVGTMATGFATAISFWLGSSQGSRDKDDTVRQMQLNHAAQTAELLAKVQQHPLAPAAVSKPQSIPEPAAAAPPAPASNVVPMQPAHASNFKACLLEVLHLEGGFSDDPRDPGGPTNFGITRAELADVQRVPVNSITEDIMRALTLDEAAGIYQSRYWNVLRCEDVPLGVDLMLFHFGVNAGPATSARMLQTVVGTACDGIVGRQTTTAACRTDAAKLIDDLAQAQIKHYRTLEKFSTYGNGWINRVNRAQKVAKGMVVPSASVVTLAAA
jgi:lysozyme family protein